MSCPTFRITAGPSISATVLADLNTAGQVKTQRSGFSLGEAGFTVDAAGALVEGTRTITLPLSFPDPVRAGQFQSQVVTALTSGVSTWLHFQRNPSQPHTWFRLRPGPYGVLNWERVWGGQQSASEFTWILTLTADAFAYGARITQPVVTLGNDPTTGTPDLSYLLPPIEGDVPARASVTLTPSVSWARLRPLLAVSPLPRDSAQTTATVWQAEACTGTAGNPLPAPTSGASWAHGGQTVDFMSSTAPGYEVFTGPSSVPAGRYLVLLRVGNGDPGAPGRVSVSHSFDENPSFVNWCPERAGVNPVWLTVGEMSLPAGADMTDLAGVVPSPALAIRGSSLYIPGDESGTPYRTRLDAIMLVPVQEAGAPSGTVLAWQYGSTGASSTVSVTVDGLTGQLLHRGSTGGLASLPGPAVSGAWPVLSPGVPNLLTLLHNTGSGDATAPAGDDKTATCSVVVSYHPRYLHLAGA